MQESVGKRIAREHFYRSCLPQWMTRSQLRSGSFLLLLGKDAREIPLLDELGVRRSKIWSVERQPNTYQIQEDSNLGISMYYGELQDYLLYLLHHDQGCVVQNLDIEGSYLNHLDPAMTSVLLFCWRNPETVVATYSNIGRDTKTLWEGVKSLISFIWLSPQTTMEFCARLQDRYRQAGFRNPIHMVLRDLFWIRSTLEHSLTTSVFANVSEHRAAQAFFASQARLFKLVAENCAFPVHFGEIHLAVASSMVDNIMQSARQAMKDLRTGLVIRNQQHVIYRATPPWAHRCYYAKLISKEPPMPCKEWLDTMLSSFLADPLIYIGREGKRSDIREAPDSPPALPADLLICDKEGLFDRFTPRTLPMEVRKEYRPTIESIMNIRRRMIMESRRRASRPPQPPSTPSPPGESMPRATRQRRPAYVRGGKITEAGREEVKALAWQGYDPAEILKKLGKNLPEGSVRAFVARARRPALFFEDGQQKLTDYGKNFIRDLTRRKTPFEDIVRRAPNKASAAQIRGVMRGVRK